VAGVAFSGVGKIYADGTRAVSDMDLEIADGEFMVLVGPSGCGKTTALRMVAGLEEISEGVIQIGDRVVNHLPARERDIAMVFQSYALYPHLSVYDNIAFGLRLRNMPKDDIDRRVREAARVLGLEEFLDRKPRALSGGPSSTRRSGCRSRSSCSETSSSESLGTCSRLRASTEPRSFGSLLA
jgi:multiple sugar transport system ATP-binding protein